MDTLLSLLTNLRSMRHRMYQSICRHPRLIACALATVVLCATSAAVLFSDVGAGFGRNIPVMSGIQLVNSDDPGHSQIGFALVPLNIDIPSSSLTLNWWPTGCSSGSTAQLPPPDWSNTTSWAEMSKIGCGRVPGSFTAWVDSMPFHSWDFSDVLVSEDNSSLVSFTPQETFDTSHNFTWISADEVVAFRRQHSISAWYPFDKYTASTTIEVFSSVGGDNFAALPIRFVHLYGGLSGYSFDVDRIEHVKTSRTDQALYLMFSIRRCIGVKIFAVTLFLTNYILAAAMVWVAVCAHFGPAPLPESALVLPLTNILLLPQLRAAMPGVPDFGKPYPSLYLRRLP